MELKIFFILGTTIVMLHVSEARPYPNGMPEADSEQDDIMAADKRPKYMTTNDLSAFQDSDLYSMEEIAEEDNINQKLLVPKSATAPDVRVERRGKRRTLCIVRSMTVVIIIPCWKHT